MNSEDSQSTSVVALCCLIVEGRLTRAMHVKR